MMTEIEILKAYKCLSLDKRNHQNLTKEKKVILYTAMLLESNDVTVLGLCLDVLENFVSNEETHHALLSTFGVYEALESLSMRVRKKNYKIYRRSSELTEILKNSAPPALNTRSKRNGPIKKHQLYSLYLAKLTKNDIPNVEQAFLQMKGIISFLLDVERKRCTIRICPKITIKEVIEKLYIELDMEAFVVTKNSQTREEEEYNNMNYTTNRSCEYPEDKTLSPDGKAIIETARYVSSRKNIFKSVINMWNEAFYW